MFNSHSQREGESFECFYTIISSIVKTCDYCTDGVDSIVRDKIVIRVKDSETQQALLKEQKLPLANAVNICKVVENAQTQDLVIRADVINKI